MKKTALLTPARRAARLAAAAAVLALAGCASGPNANPRDPLEPFNRKVMEFNDGVDAVVLKPVATVYKENVPPMVRTGVSNFFGNLGDGWNFVNSVLQFKFQNAAENWMRLNVNTFFGLGGILDIASDLNIERHKEDFGQTLGRWGAPAGPFIMLPLFGPSTLRDTIALPVDRRYNLMQQIDPEGVRNGLYVLNAVDTRANLLRVTEVLEGAALDKYSFIRDSHLQKRRAEIYEGTRRSQDDNNAGSDGAVPPAGAASAPAAPAAR
jgi:phospholipid-binding lipoprotein MlaA